MPIGTWKDSQADLDPGSGIFVTPGLVYVQTGSPCGAIVAWVLAGIISLLGALCYAELVGIFHCRARPC